MNLHVARNEILDKKPPKLSINLMLAELACFLAVAGLLVQIL